MSQIGNKKKGTGQDKGKGEDRPKSASKGKSQAKDKRVTSRTSPSKDKDKGSSSKDKGSPSKNKGKIQAESSQQLADKKEKKGDSKKAKTREQSQEQAGWPKETMERKTGGAGPIVRDKKEGVQKGVFPARRSRGDNPR